MPVLGVINKEKVPVKIWSPLHEVEGQAIEQLCNTASLPFVFKHVAAMPDCHVGKGATVGSVVATKGAICPCLVGVDIGCGMRAFRTTLDADKVTDVLGELRRKLEEAIPLGRDSNAKVTTEVDNWMGWQSIAGLSKIDHDLYHRSRNQLGSLGGGNHFIEVCLDTEGGVWVMLHSGSRNLGKTIAERHIHDAKDLMRRMFVTLRDPDLAYFVQDTKEFKDYWNDLTAVQAYALANREEMARRVKAVLRNMFGDFNTDQNVDCHHNYASREHHYGENVIVTRKGAVKAAAGDLGIIPGSMGTKSFIVRGLGNPLSFNSCSHGAGRKLSRSAAKNQFTLADLRASTEGVECRKDESVIDEIPLAYKDIDQVMNYQSDLVEVVATLKQILCVKG